MAHLINFNQKTGKHSFMSTKEKAWHNLGQIIDRYPTSKEAIQFAGLDYIVEKRPLFTYDTENHLANSELFITDNHIELRLSTSNDTTVDILEKKAKTRKKH
jgi:hypothetical protein